MSSPLSNELFFEAYRGISNSFKPEWGHGHHWSASPEVADKFTFRNSVPESTLFHAQIPMSSVETNKDELRKAALYSPEKEITAKKGSTIFLTGKTTFNRREGKGDWEQQRRRTTRYSEPKPVQIAEE